MGTTTTLEAFLTEQLVPLRGRFREVAIHLSPPAGVEVVPGSDLLDREALRERVARFGERIGTVNQRIAAAHWLGQLGYALLPPIELAMTRAGIGLDAGLENIGVVQPDGQPAAILIRDPRRAVVLAGRYAGPLPPEAIGRPVATAEELRRFVLDGLFGRTFLPLVTLLHDLTGVSPQVLWGQVSYEADLFLQQLVRVDPEARTADWEEDRAAFFARETWPLTSGPNPLCGPTRVIQTTDAATGEPSTRTLRATCCLIYQVPTGKMCGACPLAPKRETVKEKLAHVGERRAAMAASAD